ncbi:MAG: cupin domain-containing protein [Actinomycetota bacterium]
MDAPRPVDISALVAQLVPRTDRRPGDDAGSIDWAAQAAPYRDGSVFAVHYAGESEWERHPAGDEIVVVVDGATTMTLVVDGDEHRVPMRGGEMIVVPQGVWHRFSTPELTKIMTVTPLPTDHRLERPDAV